MGTVELATTAFGQGVSVTPIQQVTAVSAVVNGGYLYKPYIVKNISNRNTNVIINENNKSLVRKVISSETSSIMRRALESVVAKGGGRSAYIEGYRIGGKTGTAQKVENGKYLVGNYIMSFMAVVPSNDPQAVLYLAIDNPKNTALLSSYTTTPIARRILLDIIEALEKENIDSRPIWNPMHLQPVFKDYDFITLKEEKSNAEDIFMQGVCLPSDTKMTREEQERVIQCVKQLF